MIRSVARTGALVALLTFLGTGPACGTELAREAAKQQDPLSKEVSQKERGQLIAAIQRAMSAMPTAPAPYERAPDDSTLEVDRRAFWDPATRRWTAPARATSERVFLPRAAEDDSASDGPDGSDLPALEYRVYLNHEPELPQGLASAGGAPRQFPLPGAVAVEVTLIGADGDGGRVALPLSPEGAYAAPTAIRIYLGNREMESAVRHLLAGGQLAGSIFPGVAHAGEVHSIVVEIYGPKRVVEGLAPAVDVPGLRKVLSGSLGKEY